MIDRKKVEVVRVGVWKAFEATKPERDRMTTVQTTNKGKGVVEG